MAACLFRRLLNTINLGNPAKNWDLLLSNAQISSALRVSRWSNANGQIKHFHSSALLCKKEIPGAGIWLEKNKEIFPPQEPHEPRRPAWVCHNRDNIKYSTKNMQYLAAGIRGMSVDEAIKQLSHVPKKGAQIIVEVLKEAQELAVNEHHVEYRSNLWVGESFVGRGRYIKGLRKHARMRFGVVKYRYCHYFVRLVEGPPPKHYYPPEATGYEKLQEYIQELRDRRIVGSL
ncbi:large ribosomal subunit protein uL22m [Centruroides vittatus]|uniref:large ribosomal subunit protein uL22m n=1 Tax=Centruroides vittatus TaxID=120091 RepID=UPI00350F48BC